ncbi:MAG: replicative DNA helicase [Thermaurantimonas sp.]
MEQISQIAPAKKKDKSREYELRTGTVPPHDAGLEEAILGALLIDSRAIGEVLEILQPEHFYVPKHGIIFSCIKELFSRSEPVDILTVSAELKKTGNIKDIGGDAYLVYLSQRVFSSAHVEYHSRIILEKYLLREIIHISGQLEKKAFMDETDPIELLDETEQRLFELTAGNLKRNFTTAGDLVKDALKQMEEISKKEGLSGVTSGFKALDSITGGWQRSDLIILAARPSMGKTAFVLSLARNMAIENNIPVAFFSLEMSAVQLIMRLISSETSIPNQALRNGKLSPEQWNLLYSKSNKLEKAPLFIDDTPSISIFDLRAKCRRLKAIHDIQCVIIDYLQLMTGGSSKGGTREQEISSISRALKVIAKELNIPVIALAQVNRAVESRGGSDKRPMLSDLRESGAIEQDADIVSFLYRPEYYKMETWEDGTPCKNQAELIISKHRNGALKNVRFRFDNETTSFVEMGIAGEMESFDPNELTFESKINRGEGMANPPSSASSEVPRFNPFGGLPGGIRGNIGSGSTFVDDFATDSDDDDTPF